VIPKQEEKPKADPKPQPVKINKPRKENGINYLSRFDNIDWGDAPKPDMIIIEERYDVLEAGVWAYTRGNDHAPEFGLPPGMIIYYFKNNRFFKIEVIWEPNKDDYRFFWRAGGRTGSRQLALG